MVASSGSLYHPYDFIFMKGFALNNSVNDIQGFTNRACVANRFYRWRNYHHVAVQRKSR
jgi:hypothetical protein